MRKLLRLASLLVILAAPGALAQSASVSINDATVIEGDTGTRSIMFTLTVVGNGATARVDYATSDGTATAGSDYDAQTGTVSLAPGPGRSISVTVRSDSTDEANETFNVTLSNPVNATITRAQATGSIVDDDGGFTLPPTISIGDASVGEGNSGLSDAAFTVSLSSSSTSTVTVSYATSDVTASAGDDYDAQTGVVTFAPGTTTRSITIKARGDTLDEADETFAVDLSSAVNAVIIDSRATGTITDDDAAPSLSIDDVAVREGDAGTTGVVFTVRLSAPSGRPVTVSYATAAGTASAGVDYISATGALTFAPGVVSMPVVVTVNGDAASEAQETFFVNLSGAGNASLADSQGVGTILDDEKPRLSIGNATVTEGDDGSTGALFVVSLSNGSTETVSVQYATAAGSASAGTDFTAASGSLDFPPGASARSVPVPILADRLDEVHETFRVILSSPAGAVLVNAEGVGTILDDDAEPALSIAGTVEIEGDDGATDARLVVTLSAPSGREVSVDYATVDGSAGSDLDYLPAAGTLAFPAGATSRDVSVSVLGDGLHEGDEHFTVVLSGAILATLAGDAATCTIQDDDAAPALSVGDVSVSDDAATEAVFAVTLSVPSALEVRVDFATVDATALAGQDYDAATGTLVFAPGETEHEVEIAIRADTEAEYDETFALALAGPQNALIADGQGVATIVGTGPAPGGQDAGPGDGPDAGPAAQPTSTPTDAGCGCAGGGAEGLAFALPMALAFVRALRRRSRM